MNRTRALTGLMLLGLIGAVLMACTTPTSALTPTPVEIVVTANPTATQAIILATRTPRVKNTPTATPIPTATPTPWVKNTPTPFPTPVVIALTAIPIPTSTATPLPATATAVAILDSYKATATAVAILDSYKATATAVAIRNRATDTTWAARGATPTPTVPPVRVLPTPFVPTPTPSMAEEVAIPIPIADSEIDTAREYALSLINDARNEEGLQPLVLGTNDAAQKHAEDALNGCFSSHWGRNGWGPPARFTAAGGYNYSRENISGYQYCLSGSRWARISSSSFLGVIKRSHDSLMASPGHREAILDPIATRVNLGLWWDAHRLQYVQQFEYDLIEMEQPPRIEEWVLYLKGRAKTENGAFILTDRNIAVSIFYDPPPHELTRGQLGRTHCYSIGRRIASLRRIAPPRTQYTTNEFTSYTSGCMDPYRISPGIKAPKPPEPLPPGYILLNQGQRLPGVTVPYTSQWIDAQWWRAKDNEFDIEANIYGLLEKYGEGVYTVIIWVAGRYSRYPAVQYTIVYGIPPLDMQFDKCKGCQRADD